MTKRTGLAIILLISLVLLPILSGCGQKTAAANTPAPTTSPATPQPATPAAKTTDTPTPSPTPKPSPTVKPTLSTVPFTLSLGTDQEYMEYTLPLYLKKDDLLHMNWVVTSGGDHLSFSFMTPDGETVILKRDGTIVRNYPDTYPDEKLFTTGNIIFRPSDYGWREGYYLFRPHIRRGDANVGAKILYWIEN